MKKNLIKLAVSFGILIVLLLYIDKLYMDKEREEDSKRLFSSFTEQAQKISFEIENSEKFSFERREKGWMMIEPKSFYCENSRVDPLINQLKTLTYNQELKKNIDADFSFGLDNPYLKVEVSGKEKEYEIIFGEKTYDNRNYYMEINSSPDSIFIVSSYIVSMFNPDVYYYKSRNILEDSKNEIDKIEVSSDEMNFTINFNPDGAEFNLQKNGEEVEFDEEAALRIMDDLRFLRAERWIDVDNAGLDFDFTEPLYTVKIYSNNEQKVILIIEPGSEVYGKLTDSTEIFVLPDFITRELENIEAVNGEPVKDEAVNK